MPELRRKPRVLTHFLCRELLYDYMTGQLNEERKASVEAYLRESSELQAELAAMKAAARYCEQLAQTRLSEDLVQNLSQVRLPMEILAEKVSYRNWPDILKWSTEAAVISVCVAGIAIAVPWNSLQKIFDKPVSNEVILANVEKTIDENKVQTPPLPPAPKETEEPAEIDVDQQVQSTPVVTTGEPKKPEPQPTAPPAATVATNVSSRPAEKRSNQPQGLLYRIMMNHHDTKRIAPEIRDAIIRMGGKRAGQVEIGWRKSNGNYFHISLPEKEYQNLITTLGAYGPVRIYKNPHQRVMPPGIIRIILWIEDVPGAEDAAVSAETSEAATEPAEQAEQATEPAPANALEDEQ